MISAAVSPKLSRARQTTWQYMSSVRQNHSFSGLVRIADCMALVVSSSNKSSSLKNDALNSTAVRQKFVRNLSISFFGDR